jgi:hypothetical protein
MLDARRLRRRGRETINPLWIALILLGAVLSGVGLWLLLAPRLGRDRSASAAGRVPCERLLKAWRRAQAEHEDLRRKADAVRVAAGPPADAAADAELRRRAYVAARGDYERARTAAPDDAGRRAAAVRYEDRLREISDPAALDKLRGSAGSDRDRRRRAEVERRAEAERRAAEALSRAQAAEAAYRACVETGVSSSASP